MQFVQIVELVPSILHSHSFIPEKNLASAIYNIMLFCVLHKRDGLYQKRT